jgi:hypothetical protein
MDQLDREHVEVVPSLPPPALSDDQPGALEHADVLHGGTAVEFGEPVAQLAGRARVVLQQVEDLPAGAVGERLEEAIERGVVDRAVNPDVTPVVSRPLARHVIRL